MRQFVLVAHEAPTEPEFSLDDLPGAGRLDVLCRCVGAAFLLSHDLRTDVRVQLVVGDEYTITFAGEELRNLNPDERSTAALIRTALEHREEAIGRQPVESTPGVTIRRRDVERAIQQAARDGTLVTLHEGGTPIVDTELPADPTLVLSDHRDFTPEERSLLDNHADRTVSLGPERLHGDHAITIAHNYLDTDGYRTY
jgi:tRNA (pseudouridine54-N1)-methyltransferase